MSDPIRGRGPRLGALILFAAATNVAWSSDPFQIDKAVWDAEKSRLTVRGKGDDGSDVVVTNAGPSATLIGEDHIDHEDWRVRVYELASVPCRVRATQSNGEVDERNVKYAPTECDDGSNGGGGNPPPGGDVSINSTSQSCGSADVSGRGVACNDAPVPERPFVGNSGNHAILAINDLGMHCGDLDTRISSILPPFQVLLAQVIRKGSEPRILSPDDDVSIYYSAVSNANDPILNPPDGVDVFRGLTADGSVYKTNFWDYPMPAGTYDAFYPSGLTPLDTTDNPAINQRPVEHDVGLLVPNVERLYIEFDGTVLPDFPGTGDVWIAQQDMPGIADPYVATNPFSNDPQHVEEYLTNKPFFPAFPFGYIANDVSWFEGAGIPYAAYDDAGRENAYPLVRVEATTDGQPPNDNNVVATVDTVLPISGEASCRNCHADPMDPNFGGSRTDIPTAALTEVDDDLVANSGQDPLLQAGKVPVDVAVEWATDINVLRLHDLKHGSKYVGTDCVPENLGPDQTCQDAGFGTPCTIDGDNLNGDGPNCLTYQALEQDKPVVCQVCHYTPALDLAQLGPKAGEPGTLANGRNQLAHQSNSRVMHNHHGQFTDLFPPIDPPVQDGNGGISNQATRLAQLEESCYQCHPGTNVQCLRGAMFDGGMLCSDCHGDMAQVGADFTEGVSPDNPGDFKLGLGNYYDPHDTDQPRVPWANEPGCGSCHTGDFNDNLAGGSNVVTNVADNLGNADNIRLRQAWRLGDPMAKPIVPSNTRFAENPIPASFNGFDNPGAGTFDFDTDGDEVADATAANPKLYRVSTGHGGVFCEGCHGATHAEFDSDAPALTNDDVTAMQLQGHAGTIVECSVCHDDAMDDEITLDGPHGMHPVGANTRFADGGHEELAKHNLKACQACHGPGNYKSPQAVGTVLSLAKADRDFRGLDKGGLVTKGEPIGCATCHDSED